MRIGAIVTARRKHGRWPDKAVTIIGGLPIVEQVLKRTKEAVPADIVVLATSTNKEDKEFDGLGEKYDTRQCAGPPTDLFRRHQGILTRFDLDYIIQIPCNFPFFDVGLAAILVETIRKYPGYDYYIRLARGQQAAGGNILSAMGRGFFGKIKDLMISAASREPITGEQYWLWVAERPHAFSGYEFDLHKFCGKDLFIRTAVIYPYDAYVFNRMIDYIGSYPSYYDEIERAYMEMPEV